MANSPHGKKSVQHKFLATRCLKGKMFSPQSVFTTKISKGELSYGKGILKPLNFNGLSSIGSINDCFIQQQQYTDYQKNTIIMEI